VLTPRLRRHVHYVELVLNAAREASAAGEHGGGLAFQRAFVDSVERQMNTQVMSLEAAVIRAEAPPTDEDSQMKAAVRHDDGPRPAPCLPHVDAPENLGPSRTLLPSLCLSVHALVCSDVLRELHAGRAAPFVPFETLGSPAAAHSSARLSHGCGMYGGLVGNRWRPPSPQWRTW
jgi:hypothetical protein